jgi:hypothetical protein
MDGVAWGEDAIELEKTLYYAYVSLSRHYKTITTAQPTYSASEFTPISVLQDQSPLSINVNDQSAEFNPSSDKAPIPVLRDELSTSMDIDDPLPSLRFGQSQNNDGTPPSSILPANGLSYQDMDSEDRGTSKLSETQRQKRREKAKMRKIALRKASLTAQRSSHLDHKFPCPAHSCDRRLNRAGVLDHV